MGRFEAFLSHCEVAAKLGIWADGHYDGKRMQTGSGRKPRDRIQIHFRRGQTRERRSGINLDRWKLLANQQLRVAHPKKAPIARRQTEESC